MIKLNPRPIRVCCPHMLTLSYLFVHVYCIFYISHHLLLFCYTSIKSVIYMFNICMNTIMNILYVTQ